MTEQRCRLPPAGGGRSSGCYLGLLASQALRSAKRELRGKPLIVPYMHLGLSLCTTSQPNPEFSIAPGCRFSTNISQPLINGEDFLAVGCGGVESY